MPDLTFGSLDEDVVATAPTPGHADDEVAAGVVGHYHLIDVIGRGGMGVVYRARDLRLGRDVAIKMARRSRAIAPELWQEARTLAALGHDNVVTVFDVGDHGGRPYVVMELLHGESLQDRLRRGPIDVADAVGWTVDILEGLAAAHAHGVVHLDLKPGNLFVTARGRIKILDFGIARLAGDHALGAGGVGAHALGAGRVAGTPTYMAPEQAVSAAVDERTDLYAFGRVLFDLFAGGWPDTELEQLARACTAVDPAARPASASAVLPAVTRLVRDRVDRAPPPPGVEPPVLVRAADVASYVAAPIGRFFAGPTFLHFFADPHLCGTVFWDRPVAADIAQFVQAVASELPGTTPRHAAIVDARRLTAIDDGAFRALVDYFVAHGLDFQPNVYQQAIVRPDGAIGAVVSGFNEVARSTTPERTRIFTDPGDALTWLGRPPSWIAAIDSAVSAARRS